MLLPERTAAPATGAPPMMYQALQTAAYAAHDAFAARVTDSTPDQPPTFTPPDMAAAAAAKRDAIRNRPAK